MAPVKVIFGDGRQVVLKHKSFTVIMEQDRIHFNKVGDLEPAFLAWILQEYQSHFDLKVTTYIDESKGIQGFPEP